MIKTIHLKNIVVNIIFLLLSVITHSEEFIDNIPSNNSPIRALHIVIPNSTQKEIIRLIDLASSAKFNTIIVDWRNGVSFKNYPGVLLPNTLSPKQLLELVQYAEKKGLVVIPEIKLLTHQEVFFGNKHPSLMYNKVTYDPNKPEVYKLIFPYLNEIIELLHPKAIHIGHDELVGWNKRHFNKKVNKGENPLPAELFLYNINIIHSFLQKNEIKTWIWGDMLIDPKETLANDRNFHGSMPGYGKELRQKIPRDIVIADWHYGEDKSVKKQIDSYPSINLFKDDGFKVLGATWKNPHTIKTFSLYASENGSDGMIATTWFHVRKKEWAIVENIIHTSGNIFLKNFPDYHQHKK